ncbi:MAG: LPXTG cell wall anchor domain-containing protein [Pararhodobacter sp.]|nr:LPXTG cell wall anchor domain-containing protein [Pararhodobacter sp.]
MASAPTRPHAPGWTKSPGSAAPRSDWRACDTGRQEAFMIIIAGMLIGAISGVIYVRRRNGRGFDIAQYAAVWAIIGTILGVILTIGVERLI